MADGFLSPEGKFYEKTEVYHAETARRILGGDRENPDPVSELIRRGYLALIEFRTPGSTVSLQPDLDYVIGRRGGALTDAQINWLREHTRELSSHQQYTVNMDREGIFRDLELSDIRNYPFCEECPYRRQRMDWCGGKLSEEPGECGGCIPKSEYLEEKRR